MPDIFIASRRRSFFSIVLSAPVLARDEKLSVAYCLTAAWCTSLNSNSDGHSYHLARQLVVSVKLRIDTSKSFAV